MPRATVQELDPDFLDARFEHARGVAKRLFRSQCKITRRGSAGVFNPDTGGYNATTTIQNYNVPCLVLASQSLRERVVEFGKQSLTTRSYTIRFPITVTDVRKEDVLTITKSPDPRLVGRTLDVIDASGSDWRIWRVVTAEEAE